MNEWMILPGFQGIQETTIEFIKLNGIGSIGSEATLPTKSMKMIFMIGNTSNATMINGLEVEMEEFGGMYNYIGIQVFQVFFFQEIEPFSPFKCKLIFLKLYNKEELNLAIKSPSSNGLGRKQQKHFLQNFVCLSMVMAKAKNFTTFPCRLDHKKATTI